MKNISGLITTYNSERALEACLKSLQFCEKIFVIDSFSTDSTEEICKQFENVVFLQNPWIRLEEQFYFGLKHITTEWVIILDSDEYCSDELQLSIKSFLGDGEIAKNEKFNGSYIPRRSYFFYKFMKHSDAYPDFLLRLFKKDKFGIKSSGRHQDILIDGNVSKLKGDIIHYPYVSFENYMQKLSEYADFAAKEKTKKGQKFSLTSAILHSLWGFFRIYFFKRGILDGKAGFIMATHHAFYVYMKYIRIGENEDTFGINKMKK